MRWAQANRVVSIGAVLSFKVIFTPLEYIPTIPPLSFNLINILFSITTVPPSSFIYLWFPLTNINDVGGKRSYSRKILQWCKNDFKSKNSTNGDCMCVQGDYCSPKSVLFCGILVMLHLESVNRAKWQLRRKLQRSNSKLFRQNCNFRPFFTKQH